MTLFENKLFADVNCYIKMTSHWIRMSPNPITGVLIRRPCEDTDTHKGRKSCDTGGRDWSDVSLWQGTPRIVNNHQNLGKRYRTFSSSEPPEGTSPANTLISDF